jgi:Fe-S cluster biosynthesis and repair protein YggX
MDKAMLGQRIAQWENMTQADPANAMGWFSLGGAYREAGREEEAARVLRKAIELDPSLSRAYQLLGQVLIAAKAEEQAADVLLRGYVIAAERGEVMPQKAMGSMLQTLGKPLPQVKGPEPVVSAVAPTDGNTVLDRRTGQPGAKLPSPPFRGPLGRFIFDHYSAATFRQWIGQGTKVINELRLDFSNEAAQRTYDLHMMEWLGFTQEEVDEYARQTAQQQQQ